MDKVEWYGTYVSIPQNVIHDEEELKRVEEDLKENLAEAVKLKMSLIRHFGDLEAGKNTIAVKIGIFNGEPDEDTLPKIYVQSIKEE